MNPLQVFRDKLLRETVEWCQSRSDFYRVRFAGLTKDFAGMEDLPKLPILFRDEAAAEAQRLLCANEQPACVQYTTGTTGTFFQLFRSHQEISYIGHFFNELLAEPASWNGPRPLCLSLTSAYHGSQTPVPSRFYILTAGVYDRTQAMQAKSILAHQYSMPGVEPRVSVLIGADILIKALTAFLINEGFDFGSCCVRNIIMTGGYVSPARKRQLSQIWKSNIIDRYSTSEIFGGATESGVGGFWSFDPELIPEVVHPRTLKAVDSGIGVLVLTGLYPFVQMMPMIRYYTGDLVEIVSSLNDGNLLVRFLGRERRSVLDTTGDVVQPLLLSAPFHGFLETFPDLAVSPRFIDIGAQENLEFAGKLHYAIDSNLGNDSGKGIISIRLGLRYPPWLYPDRITEIATKIRDYLYSNSPFLRERVMQGDIELKIRPLFYREVPPFNAK